MYRAMVGRAVGWFRLNKKTHRHPAGRARACGEALERRCLLSTHYYAFTSTSGTWEQVEQEAVSHGGHLVSITSQAEQDFINSEFVSPNSSYVFWTGLTDSAEEGVFRWSNGDAVSYDNWKFGEPNDLWGEDYVSVNWNYVHRFGSLGDWNDEPLNGVDGGVNIFSQGNPEPHWGIMEFNSPPVGVTQTVKYDPEPDVLTSLSFRDALGNPLSSATAGQTVYLRADTTGMNSQTIQVQLWEDDGIGDDLIVTKSITIGESGSGVASWTVSWQSLDADDPQNSYYLYYPVSNQFSGSANTGHFQVVQTPWVPGNEFKTWLSHDWDLLPDVEGEIEVILDRRFEDGINIDPSKPTWIVIHGWTDSFYPEKTEDNDTTMYDLAHAAFESASKMGMQLLTLDWVEGASRLNVGDGSAEDWIQPVAQWAADALKVAGFASAKLSLLGQSYGAVMSGELADRFGGVHGIIALDPANNHPSDIGYDTESVNFAAHSDYSWGFLTSQFGSGDSVVTADVTFMVDTLGDNWSDSSSHSHAKHLYKEILHRNANGTAGDVSRTLGFERFTAMSEPWRRDEIDGGALTGSWAFPGEFGYSDPEYEAVLTVQASDDENTVIPVQLEFVNQLGTRARLQEAGPSAATIVGAADFNADTKPDLLWRNNITGENFVWLTNGSSFISTPLTTTSDTRWRVGGIGDFNGDGSADILFHNLATGVNAVWFMIGISRIGGAQIFPTTLDLNWSIAGVADFDGDTKADILWRNYATGANTIWLMDKTTRIGPVAIPVTADVRWQVGGVADFNGDKKPDIVWHNTGTNANAVWYMNGTSRISAAPLPSNGSPGWRLCAAADFDGDTKPDLVWRNPELGADALWLMVDTTRKGTAALPPL